MNIRSNAMPRYHGKPLWIEAHVDIWEQRLVPGLVACLVTRTAQCHDLEHIGGRCDVMTVGLLLRCLVSWCTHSLRIVWWVSRIECVAEISESSNGESGPPPWMSAFGEEIVGRLDVPVDDVMRPGGVRPIPVAKPRCPLTLVVW
jgi:hypothetical protein